MPMQNNGGCRRAQGSQKPAPQCVPELPVPETSEPPMRRWPHPTQEAPSPESLPAELYRLDCALSQQTRLLSEIKTLLEGLAGKSSP